MYRLCLPPTCPQAMPERGLRTQITCKNAIFFQSQQSLSAWQNCTKGPRQHQSLRRLQQKGRSFLLPISFAVSRLLCFSTGCVASTEPGGKVMSRRIMGGWTAAGVMCEAGTGGPAFCIFIPECRNGDLLGEVRFSRGLGRGAGLDT